MVEIDSGGKSIKKKKKLTGRQLSLRFSRYGKVHNFQIKEILQKIKYQLKYIIH